MSALYRKNLKKKIGITGGTSVIGRKLIKKLNQKVTLFKNDINKKNEVNYWVKKNQFDTIIHLAAIVPIDKFNKSKVKSFNTNLIGTKNIVDALKKFSKKKVWFFFSSTSHVYKVKKKKIKVLENSTLDPYSKYGLSKKKAEDYIIKQLSESKIIKYCIGRIFSFTDLNQEKSFFVPNVMSQIINKDKVIFKNVNHYRDFLSIYDVINSTNESIYHMNRCSIFIIPLFSIYTHL